MINKLIEERRVGIFGISTDTLHDSEASALLALFANFIIVRAEALFIPPCVEYTAYSPLFGATDANEEVPEYAIEGTSGTVTVRRIE